MSFFLLLCNCLLFFSSTVVVSSSQWLEVLPIPVTYCPTSPIEYDCEAYQRDVWNAPSLTSTPYNSSGIHPRLVVFLPGTGSTPHQFRNGLLRSWQEYGKAHVMGLSYVSTPYPVSVMNRLCGDDKTNGRKSVAECLGRLHETELGGDDSLAESPLWRGLRHNDAIEHRILMMLESLHNLGSNDGWNNFYESSNKGISSLLWDRIIISGHSQGGTHAAYIGHKRKTAQVVLLSSPGDCCTYSSYVSLQWKTPTSQVSAFYHLFEDSRGIISQNIGEILPDVSPVQFNPIIFLSPAKLSDRVFYSTMPPQIGCPCNTREEHCSTATDMCSPQTSISSELDDNSPTLYAYHRLWQYLAFGEVAVGNDMIQE